MTERTRRATEVVDAHTAYLEASRPGTMKARIEGGILDPMTDPARVANPAATGIPDPDPHFQGAVRDEVAAARPYTATIDLFREVLLTVEMMAEEGLEYLPLTETTPPAPSGIFLFPHGVENPHHLDNGARTLRTANGTYRIDSGAGDRHMIDGFIWYPSAVRVPNGESKPGLGMITLTRWRGRREDRPFRPAVDLAETAMPPLVGSDITGWAFDDKGATGWDSWDMDDRAIGHSASSAGVTTDEFQQNLVDTRMFYRSLVWSTFRWLTEEIQLVESGDRASTRRLKRARPVFHETLPEDGQVVIADLRPERRDEIERAGDSGEPPWWRSRWIVRAHYAKRRYAIRDADGRSVGPVRGPDSVEGVTFEYRRVLIEAHMKGPENAPLVYREVVGVLTR